MHRLGQSNAFLATTRLKATEGPAWAAQLAKLVAYKAVHGDCKVPRRWPEDPRLANWFDNQHHGSDEELGERSDARATTVRSQVFSIFSRIYLEVHQQSTFAYYKSAQTSATTSTRTILGT